MQPRAARVIGLGYGAVALIYVASRLLLIWRFPVHVDEATFAQWTLDGHEQGGAALFRALAGGQQPLLPWLGVALMKLGLEPVTALRFVSFAAGAATLVVVAIFATRLFGSWTGLLAAALYTLVPFTLLYSALGLYDPLATLFITAAMVLQFEHARQPRLDLALALGLVLAGAVLTKLTAYSALYLIPLSALAFDWSRPALPRRLLAWLGGLGLALLLAFVASRVLLLSDLADDLPQAREVLAQNTLGEALSEPGRWVQQNWPAYRNVLHLYLTLPLVVAFAIGLGLLLRRVPRTGAFLALWIVIPLGGLVLLSSVPFGRWALIIAPQILIVTAYGLLETGRWLIRLERPVRQAALALLAAVALVPALSFDVRLLTDPVGQRLPRVDDEAYLTGFAAGTPWEAVAERLRQIAGDGPLVVAAAPTCCGVLALDLRHDRAVSIVRAESADVPEALLGLENGVALPPRADGLTWRRIETFERPRGDSPVHLYESGIVVEFEFASTPDDLRRLLGGVDAEFDAFVAARPAVRAWLDAWHRANAPT